MERVRKSKRRGDNATRGENGACTERRKEFLGREWRVQHVTMEGENNTKHKHNLRWIPRKLQLDE